MRPSQARQAARLSRRIFYGTAPELSFEISLAAGAAGAAGCSGCWLQALMASKDAALAISSPDLISVAIEYSLEKLKKLMLDLFRLKN